MMLKIEMVFRYYISLYVDGVVYKTVNGNGKKEAGRQAGGEKRSDIFVRFFILLNWFDLLVTLCFEIYKSKWKNRERKACGEY